MKLGEALSLRARQASLMDDLRKRILQNVLVQEGTEKTENPGDLSDQYLRVSSEHSLLLARIARTNAQTVVDGTERLLDLLHKREHLRRARALQHAAADAATPGRTMMRYSRSEVVYLPTINVTKARQMVEQMDEEIRVIDARIQEINWLTDLSE